MKKYPVYKESKLKWLGAVPAEWDIKEVKQMYDFVSVKVSDEDYQALSVSSKNGITPQLEHVAKTLNGDNRKRVEKGDFVINSRADRPGACGVSKYDGSVSVICHVLRPKKAMNLFPKYMHFLFRNPMFSQEFYRWGRGIVDDLWSTRKDEFGKIKIPIPPIDYQTVIGEYLDFYVENINNLIEDKIKLIELLEKNRQSKIAEVVTQGLNPNVKMKDSGVKWIGEIPEHWERVKLKHLTKMKSGESIDSLDINSVGQYKVYGGGGFRGYTSKYTHTGEYVLIGRQGALCGNVTFASGEFWATEHAVVVEANYVDIRYLRYLLEGMNLNQYSISAAQPGLSVSTILNLEVPVPTKTEQIEIAAKLEGIHVQTVQLVSDIQSQIQKLKEYRQSLIYEAVTGKIDVRDFEVKA